MRCSVFGVHIQYLLISADGFQLSFGIFFQSNAAGEDFGNIGFDQLGLVNQRRPAGRGHNSVLGREIEDELSGDRLHDCAVVPECDPMPRSVCSCFEQWIFHARYLLLHGF